MPKYVVCMVDIHTGAVMETTQEVLPDREAAQAYADWCTEAVGRLGTLRSPSGRSYCPGEDVAFAVKEITT